MPAVVAILFPPKLLWGGFNARVVVGIGLPQAVSLWLSVDDCDCECDRWKQQ